MQWKQTRTWGRHLPLMLVAGAVAIGGAGPTLAQGVWSADTSMPQAVIGPTTAVSSSKMYVVTGATGSSPPTTTANQIYNPATESWSLGAPIPTGVGGASGGFISRKVYVAGGCVSSDCRIGVTSAVEAYDTVGNSWSAVAPMLTAREGFGTGVISNHLFAVGGTSACPPCTPLNSLEVYSPVTNLWTTLPGMPTARAYFGTAVIGKKLYVVGGSDAGEATHALGTLEVYDSATQTWATKAPMPMPLSSLGAVAFNGILYAISGLDSTNVSTKIVQAYNPATNSWTTEAPIPTARYGPKPQALWGVIEVGGAGYASTIATFEGLDP